MTEIIVAGYPKSGNTWLARLMGDLMDFPITGVDEAVPIAAEGADRTGDGLVRQLHLMPSECESERFVASPHTINPEKYGGECVLHIIRDPRDVAVSIDAYWEIGDLGRTLKSVMGIGGHPLWGCGWHEYMEAWRISTLPYLTVYYDDLWRDAAGMLRTIASAFNLTPAHDIGEVVERQSFDVRRAAIEQNGESLPYGKGIQLKNMRKGEPGDWVNHFGPDHKRIAHKLFGDDLRTYGFEKSPLWWLDGAQHDEDGLIAMLDLLFDGLSDTGEELCRTLYRLTEKTEGAIVELGAGYGRTAVALSWRSQSAWSVDNYADNVDWASNVYGRQARSEYLRNVAKAGVSTTLVERDSVEAAGKFEVPVGLWCWDISAPGRLMGDWLAWRGLIRGRALIRDTFDRRLGSEAVKEYESGRGEFEIERDDPGILILRRT